ncbi:integrase [Streptomyces sp. MBT53]|uniref:integrase n=1 Tax=Streptomyces sp. MBT53 TaxID=1488384 RepID=UPI001913DCAB|nr:integrase [Streptomyces sp. MBT53]MBK6015521.1 integrase [Streptomyces sp. MBT53]
MTTAFELDPYLLPLPTPTTPVVPAHMVTAMHAHLNAQYAAPVWPLAPMTENPSAGKRTIHWGSCPAVFQDELRLAAWNLINGQLRPTFLKDRGGPMRSRLGAHATGDVVRHWMHLASWLEGRGLSRFAECGTAVLHAYGLHLLDTTNNRSVHHKVLSSLTRLWAFDQLSARPNDVGRPPWDERGADDYLPPATTRGGENTTDPLAEETMGPLLIWAIRMVDDFADDILAAWSEARRLDDASRRPSPGPRGYAALEAYFAPLIASNAPLPTTTNRGQPRLARVYIAATTGASIGQVDRVSRRHGLLDAAPTRPGPCPLDIPVSGRIHGTPWRTAINLDEIHALRRHLVTAAFVICAYLTGMRPGEVLGLRSGCCPDPEPDSKGTIGRHLIRSNEYKTATDEHGNHVSGGEEREVPWVAITPVVNAIRVLERMVPDGTLLFDHNAHVQHQSRADTGSLKTSGLVERIEHFVTWANIEALRHELPGEFIAPDPAGAIGTRRFRRSLAWHIARRPGGLVALAIQYGHLRTTFVSEGYASRSRDGIHDLIDVETVRAVSDTVAELHDDLEAGGGVSGPSARRAIRTAARAQRFSGAAITATTARRLLANENAMIYDNPQALLLCHYKREQALCHRDGVKDTPSLDRCVPGCGNIVRTDDHASQLRERASLLELQASHAPQPIGERLQAKASQLHTLAADHDRTRITL